MKIKLLPLLTIGVALALVVLVVLVLFGVGGTSSLLGAAALAGLVAVLQAGQLKNAAPTVRLVLFWAGLATLVLMGAAWGTSLG